MWLSFLRSRLFRLRSDCRCSRLYFRSPIQRCSPTASASRTRRWPGPHLPRVTAEVLRPEPLPMDSGVFFMAPRIVKLMGDGARIVREVKVASEPEALLQALTNPGYHFKRIGLEAGPLSQWLYSALAEAGLPVICVETRHMRAVLKAQINKTDRNDARGMAQMMRVGLYRPVHVKTLRSQKLRMLLTHRKLLQSKAIAID